MINFNIYQKLIMINLNIYHKLRFAIKFSILSLLTAMSILGLIFLYIRYMEWENVDIPIYIYSLIITIFQMSIISGSFLYSSISYSNKVKDEYKNGYEPYVTFVIPVKNEEKVIYNTINRCLNIDYPENKLEVIVVNDGSTDNTWKEIEKIKDKRLTAINWKENKGKKYGMAEGFRRAKGEIIIQLDSDSYLEKKCLKNFLQPFKDKQIGVVCAHTDPENKSENILTRAQTAYYFMAFRALKAMESLFGTVFCCSGCCSAYRKEYVLPILDEWLNEKFLSRPTTWDDDRSLTNLILKSEHKTIYLSSAQAYTIVPNNFKQLIKQQIRWKKSWFVSSVRASQFIWKVDKFVAILYFFPLIAITLLNPIITFKALIYDPIVYGIIPIFYLIGILLVTSFFMIHYQLHRSDENWIYMIIWIFLDMTLFSFVMIYALIDLKNLKWGTR